MATAAAAAHGRAQPWRLHRETEREGQIGEWKGGGGEIGEMADSATAAVNEGWLEGKRRGQNM